MAVAAAVAGLSPSLRWWTSTEPPVPGPVGLLGDVHDGLVVGVDHERQPGGADGGRAHSHQTAGKGTVMSGDNTGHGLCKDGSESPEGMGSAW